MLGLLVFPVYRHFNGPFPAEGVSVFIIAMLYRIFVLNANSVDPDQTPRSRASDKGLHCLPEFLLWDTRHKWVNAWPRGYKTFFMLNSAEHEICPANKSKITNDCKFFLVIQTEHENFSAN